MAFDPKKLSEDVSVSGQIMSEDIAELVEQGFKSIIINRPDHEKPDQPMASDIAKKIEDAGLAVANLPMAPGQLTLDIVNDTVKAFETLPKPILAFCASGTRSAILWCCANVKLMGVDGVLNAAKAAGYDLMQIRPALEHLSG